MRRASQRVFSGTGILPVRRATMQKMPFHAVTVYGRRNPIPVETSAKCVICRSAEHRSSRMLENLRSNAPRSVVPAHSAE